MFDFDLSADDQLIFPKLKRPRSEIQVGGTTLFWITKRLVDLVLSFSLVVPMLAIAAVLLFLNPILNPGPLFFLQRRMGRGCKSFTAIKFRTMRTAAGPLRGPEETLETDRITTLGAVMRKARIDELPQILNVLAGSMSLIGPRPDCFHHAEHYVRSIPGYRQRHAIRPGISGLAQTQLGYAVGTEETSRKVAVDLNYIHQAGFAIDAKLFIATLITILRWAGR